MPFAKCILFVFKILNMCLEFDCSASVECLYEQWRCTVGGARREPMLGPGLFMGFVCSLLIVCGQLDQLCWPENTERKFISWDVFSKPSVTVWLLFDDRCTEQEAFSLIVSGYTESPKHTTKTLNIHMNMFCLQTVSTEYGYINNN